MLLTAVTELLTVVILAVFVAPELLTVVKLLLTVVTELLTVVILVVFVTPELLTVVNSVVIGRLVNNDPSPIKRPKTVPAEIVEKNP